jgi:hypothetical protein
MKNRFAGPSGRWTRLRGRSCGWDRLPLAIGKRRRRHEWLVRGNRSKSLAQNEAGDINALPVTPAKAGVQGNRKTRGALDTCFRRNDE